MPEMEIRIFQYVVWENSFSLLWVKKKETEYSGKHGDQIYLNIDVTESKY